MNRRSGTQFRLTPRRLALLLVSGLLLAAAADRAGAGSYAIAWFQNVGEVCTSNPGSDCSVVTPGY